MKRAELGLLEVLGLVVNAGWGGMCRGELRILLNYINMYLFVITLFISISLQA